MNEQTPINPNKKSKKDKKKKKKPEKKEKKNKKDLEEGKQEDDDEGSSKSSEEEDQTCCQKFGACLNSIFLSCLGCVRSCCAGLKMCCGKIIYPFKERCCICLTRLDHRMNPYKDPGYSEV